MPRRFIRLVRGSVHQPVLLPVFVAGHSWRSCDVCFRLRRSYEAHTKTAIASGPTFNDQQPGQWRIFCTLTTITPRRRQRYRRPSRSLLMCISSTSLGSRPNRHVASRPTAPSTPRPWNEKPGRRMSRSPSSTTGAARHRDHSECMAIGRALATPQQLHRRFRHCQLLRSSQLGRRGTQEEPGSPNVTSPSAERDSRKKSLNESCVVVCGCAYALAAGKSARTGSRHGGCIFQSAAL